MSDRTDTDLLKYIEMKDAMQRRDAKLEELIQLFRKYARLAD